MYFIFTREFILWIGVAIGVMAVACFALGYICGRLARKADVDVFFKANSEQIKKLTHNAYWRGHQAGLEASTESEG